jgi:hypothetical protein
MTHRPDLVIRRDARKDAAIRFIHGFGAWGSFPAYPHSDTRRARALQAGFGIQGEDA